MNLRLTKKRHLYLDYDGKFLNKSKDLFWWGVVMHGRNGKIDQENKGVLLIPITDMVHNNIIVIK